MTERQQIKLYNKRIDAGIKWLNKFAKGWIAKIDLKNLDLNDRNACVLGFVFEDFWNQVYSDSDPYCKNEKMSFEKSISLGFAAEEKDGYDLLTHLWFCKIVNLKYK